MFAPPGRQLISYSGYEVTEIKEQECGEDFLVGSVLLLRKQRSRHSYNLPPFDRLHFRQSS
jgi:hypothetical protein